VLANLRFANVPLSSAVDTEEACLACLTTPTSIPKKYFGYCPVQGAGFDTLIKFRGGSLVTQRRSGAAVRHGLWRQNCDNSNRNRMRKPR